MILTHRFTGEFRATNAHAMDLAMKFKALFPATCYERWEIAGSLRRGAPSVGDVDHVVIPRFGKLPRPDGLFADDLVPVNLFFWEMDLLGATAGNPIRKAADADGNNTAWGQKARKVAARAGGNMPHEVYCADEDNWGWILVLRTGPDVFTKALVQRLADCGHPAALGYIRPTVKGVVQVKQIIKTPTEQKVFELAQLPWCEPERRKSMGEHLAKQGYGTTKGVV